MTGIHVLAHALTGPGEEPRGWACDACGRVESFYNDLFKDRSCPGRVIMVECEARRPHTSQSGTPA